MAVLIWFAAAFALSPVLLYALAAYALHRGLSVKTGLQIPFVAFSFETHANGGNAESPKSGTQITAISGRGKKATQKP